MDRAEFMRRLTELLYDVPPTEREEAIQYYNDYFDDAGLENESGVIASLGTPEELARTIKAGLNDGGNGGEFTESGFSGYAHVHKNEMIRTGEAGTNGQSKSGSKQFDGKAGGFGASGAASNGGSQSNNAYYESAYYQRTGGKGIYGGREDARRQSSPYESADSSSYGQMGGGSYGQEGNAGSYTSVGQQIPPQTPPPKQGMSGGMIVLIVIAAVLTSPIWLGLLGGLFGLMVGIFAAIFGIFIAFLAVGVVLVVVSIALLIAGITMLFTVPLGGICIIGTSLVLFAVGLVFIWLMVFIAAMVIPALVKGISALGRRIFHRGGARA